MSAQPSVVVVGDRYTRAWPRSDDRAYAIELDDLFTRQFSTDAHFCAYAPADPARPRRLSLDSVAVLDAPPTMRLLVVDVDAPGHESTHEWRNWIELRSRHLSGDPFGYFTRGGARFVWRIEPTTLQSADDWSRWYLSQLVTIAATTGIVCDPACHDWTHLQRAPHATRDGEVQRHGTVCGDPARVGAWADPSVALADTLAVVGSLAAQSPSWRRVMRRFDPPREARPASFSGDVSGALRWAADLVAGAGSGNRNTELYGRTRWLARLVETGELDADTVRSTMNAAGQRAGLNAAEVRRTVASALAGRSAA